MPLGHQLGQIKKESSDEPSPEGLSFESLKLRALAVMLALGGAVVAAFLFNELNMVLMGIMAVLATIGVFAVLAFGAGLLSISSRNGEADIVSVYADHLPDGVLITSKNGDVIYANDAYFHILRRERRRGAPTVESYFSGEPAIAEPLYRLSQAAHQMRNWEEEVCVYETEGDVRVPRWLRISVSPIHLKENSKKISGVVWRVEDITLKRSQRE